MSFDLNTITIHKILPIIQEVAEKYLTRENSQNITVKGDSNFVTEVVDGVEYYFVTNIRGATIIGVKKVGDTNSNQLEIPLNINSTRFPNHNRQQIIFLMPCFH